MEKVDLSQLPWWGKEGHFYYLGREELKKRFEDFPISKCMIESLVDNYVSSIWILYFSSPDLEGMIYREAPFDSLNLNISLSSYFSFEEICSNFIHECIHGIYGVNSRGVDDIIIEQERKFYSKNRNFSMKLLNKNIGKFQGLFSEDIFNRNKELIKNN